MENSFEDLLSGKMGPIRVGDSRAGVAKLLGSPAPDDISVDGEIWRYGGVEVIFYKGRVTTIGAEFTPHNAPVPAAFAGSLAGLNARCSFAETIAQLQSHGIPWAFCDTATDETQIMIRLPNGGSIVFGRHKTGGFRIWSVAVVDPSPIHWPNFPLPKGRQPVATRFKDLASGRMGPIRLSMTQGDVAKALGVPDRWSDKKSVPRGVEIWGFGPIEVSFRRGRADLIGTYYGADRPAIPVLFKETLEPLSAKTTFAEAVKILALNDVSWKVSESASDGSHTVIESPSGLSLSFDADETGEQRLVAVFVKMSMPILRSLLDELPEYVVETLREIGGAEELEALKSRSPVVAKPWVRKEFEKTIDAIERRLSKPKKTPRKRRPVGVEDPSTPNWWTVPLPTVSQPAATRFKDLDSGRMGPIRIKMTFTDVANELGPPEWTGDKRAFFRGLDLWGFGSIEITFWLGRVYLISAYYWANRPAIPELFKESLDPLSAKTTFPEALKLLALNDISWKISETSGQIESPGGLSLAFNVEETGEQRFHAAFVKDMNPDDEPMPPETDPEIEQYLRDRGKRHAAKVAKNLQDAQPVVDDLCRRGFPCNSLDDVYRDYEPLPLPLIEILLSWIPRVDNRDVKLALIHTLHGSKHSFDGRPLVEAFENDDIAGLMQWPIADTIASTKVTGINDWLIQAVRNRKYLQGRPMLLLALAKYVPSDVSLPILRSLLDEPELPGHVAVALRRIGGAEELEALKSRLPVVAKLWVRKEFEKTIKSIERRLSKPKKAPRKRRPEA